MSDFPPDEPDPDEEPDPQPERKPNFRRELEAKAQQAEEKAQRLERENAVLKAGLPTMTERQRSALMRELGDDLSPDSIKTIHAELWPSEAKTEPTSPPAEDVDAFERIAQASSGAGTSTPADPFAALDSIADEEEFWRTARANGLTT